MNLWVSAPCSHQHHCPKKRDTTPSGELFPAAWLCRVYQNAQIRAVFITELCHRPL